jgi:riboflavin kinase / FMN adenylyltransferase
METGDFFELSTDRPSVLSVGVFDGVHLGHQRLLGRTVQRARSRGAAAVVVTFDPRPREVLRPDLPSEYLVTLPERVCLLADLGFDYVSVIHFSREVAATTADEFVRVLRERYRLAELWVGPDFALGRGRGGTIPVLRELGAASGFEVGVLERVTLDGEVVSSSRIHAALAAGDVALATRLLGRPHVVGGPVVRGAARGRTLNLPTANIAWPSRIALPANGIYAVRCTLLPEGAEVDAADCLARAVSGGRKLLGAASVGIRPQFDAGERTLEVHLLDFDEDIYGRVLQVAFVEWLRPEMRFPTLEEFLAQIQRDIARTRQILGG